MKTQRKTTQLCLQCEALVINGLACHETGCPQSHIDLHTGEPCKVPCYECGTDIDAIPGNNKYRYCEDCWHYRS